MKETRQHNNRKKYRKNNGSVKMMIIVGVIVLVVLGVLGVGYYFVPQVKLKGDRVVTLNYKEKYNEKGYTAKYKNKDISKDVSVKGKVNSNKLGTYEIVYEYDGLFKKKVVRKVVVKDTSKPTITGVVKDNIYLCPGSKYNKEDIKVHDNYDGDITKNLKIKVDKDKVTYTAEDSSGNKTVVVKKIIYEDKVNPVITLNGGNYSYSFVGENFNDPGYKATDNCEGDITNKVVVTNNININKSGKYEVKYEVSDKSSNKASVVRTVIVSERGKNGTIYLTFDDGPQRGTTDVILDILKEEGVEATFFVTSKGPDDLIKREYDEGHTVALHTSSHDYAKVYASSEAFFNDLNTVSARVERVTGEKSTLIRFPGGSSNTISRRYCPGIMSYLTKEVVNRGYKYYDWNVSSGDAAGGRPTPEMIKNNVIRSLRKDRINMVLMHDIKPYTRDALRDIIKYGKNNGYTFEKITPNTEMVKQRVNN